MMWRMMTVGLATVGFGAVSLLGGGVALAQDGQGPDPQQIEQKVREVEQLMKKAEQALARSTDTRNAETAAKRLEELLDEKAREQVGKSADQLREDAAAGSAEASKALERLMREARSETAKAASKMQRLLRDGDRSARDASAGMRKLLEETRRCGEQAHDGIEWLLENAVSPPPGGS